MGDKLMLCVPDVQSNRRGVPNEKVRISLKPVPKDYVSNTIKTRMLEAVQALIVEDRFESLNGLPGNFADTDGALSEIIPTLIAAFRKSANLVVAKACSSARPNHQVDIKITAPTFL